MTPVLEISEEILAKYDNRRSNLVPILQDLQSSLRYLPEPVLRKVARKLRIRDTEVYQVATFYRGFSLTPRGKHHVLVCLGTACHVRGAQKVLDKVMTETGATATGTSVDGQFTVEPVRCLGCCGLAPVVRVDTQMFAHVEQNQVKRLLRKYKKSPAADGGAND
jgi:NADH-quinone oxidoreductase subunit E